MSCRFCNKEINNRGSLASHEKVCKRNPVRVERNRSENAGQQKGCKAWNKGKSSDVNKRYWEEKIPNEIIFTSNSGYSRRLARTRILANDLLPYVCQLCGIGNIWHGKEMPLILDHINGVNNDHRLENLRFVCSNCDSTLDTYKARNKNRDL